jgi:hypothetical protein
MYLIEPRNVCICKHKIPWVSQCRTSIGTEQCESTVCYNYENNENATKFIPPISTGDITYPEPASSTA